MTALPFAITAEGKACTQAASLYSAQLCSGFGQYDTQPRAITWQQVLDLIDNPQQVDKRQAQWLIPSTLMSRTFKEQELRGEFHLLWADIDKDPPTLAAMIEAVEKITLYSDVEIYSSRSATQDCQKWRVLVPLAKPLPGADWVLAQEVLNDKLEAEGITPDRASERAAQLCYLPNRGEFYQTHSVRTGRQFDALAFSGFDIEVKDKRDAIAAKAEESRLRREQARQRREALAATDAPDTIGAFKLAYAVDAIVLQAGYDQRGNSYRHPNSESGSYSATVKDGRIHALSSADPLYSNGQGAHDAFSAFCVLFHGGDRNAALKDAGDNWLSIGGESWNKVKQREWAQQQAGATPADFWHLSDGTLPEGIAPGSTDTQEPQRNIFDIEAARVTPEWFTQAPPPRLWLVRDLLPLGVIGVLAGQGGTFKSTAAQTLALSVASGVPFLGHEIDSPGAVVYLSAEDDRQELQRRLYAIGRHVSASDQLDTDAVARNLYMFDLVAFGFKLTQPTATGGRQITINSLGVEQLRQTIQAIGGVRLVVVDTYSRFNGGEENDNGHSATFVTACEQMRQGTGCNVLVTAHTTKAGSGNGAGVRATDVAGGARLVDAARWMAGLDRYLAQANQEIDDDKMRHVRLTVGKSNYGRVGAAYWLEYQEGALVQHAERIKPPQKEEAAQEKEKSADARYWDVLCKLRSFLTSKASEGDYFTERALRAYAGKDGIFGVGETTLRAIIQRAKEEEELFIHKVDKGNRLAIWKQHAE